MDEFRVIAKSWGGTRINLITGRYDECNMFCEEHNWEYMDENNFSWNMEIEEV